MQCKCRIKVQKQILYTSSGREECSFIRSVSIMCCGAWNNHLQHTLIKAYTTLCCISLDPNYSAWGKSRMPCKSSWIARNGFTLRILIRAAMIITINSHSKLDPNCWYERLTTSRNSHYKRWSAMIKTNTVEWTLVGIFSVSQSVIILFNWYSAVTFKLNAHNNW